MDKKKEIKSENVLDLLPQWRAQHAHECVDTGDVRQVLQQMCSCVRCNKAPTYRKGLYRMLYSWYVPRNENDADAFMARCRVWSVFTDYVDELLNCLIR